MRINHHDELLMKINKINEIGDTYEDLFKHDATYAYSSEAHEDD